MPEEVTADGPSNALPTAFEWGYVTPPISPSGIIDSVRRATEQAIKDFTALFDDPEPCRDADGYCRAAVVIPLAPVLFDQLMNGPTGYRAHYSVSIEVGETFNRQLIEAAGGLLVEAENLYNKFDRAFCQRSLLGSYSKFWFSKSITDPASNERLQSLDEEIKIPRWRDYWSQHQKPWKGLLAPNFDPEVLLNGTFVDAQGNECERKSTRSTELYETGWT